MKILVVIPAYNEEASIGGVVDDLKTNYPQYDYVVINDASTDNTRSVCRTNGYNYLDLPVNLGIGGAVQTGMKYAYLNGYDAALQFDGDGQHNAGYISKLIEVMEAEEADIVIGSRFYGRGMPFSARMIGSRLLKLLMRLFAGCKISDPTSGMRLFHRDIIKKFAYNMNYTPEPDTIAYLFSKGAKVSEVLVEMNERKAGTSYLTSARAMRYMLQMCVSIVFVQHFRKRNEG